MFDNLVTNYFSFNGRLNRKPYIMISFIHLPLATVILSGIFYLAFSENVASILLSIWSLILMVVGLSITFRRLHDLGYSKLNYLWFLIPIINIYWACKTIFVRGTYGDNEYGPDPLLILDEH